MLEHHYTTGYRTIIHFLLNSAAQKSYLKLYYVSIPPNRAPTVRQMDQDLLDNNWKDECKAAGRELRGKYELRILIGIVCHLWICSNGDVKMQ